MKLHLLVAIAFLFGANTILAQGTLQYNQSLIIGNTTATVPSGKVWKVTAVYGDAFVCRLGATPFMDAGASSFFDTKYVGYTGSSFKVNGTDLYSFRYWKGGSSNPTTTINVYNDASCMSLYGSGYTRGVLAYDINPNPNVLPMWLPAGTTVETNASTVFLSVVEFNIIP